MSNKLSTLVQGDTKPELIPIIDIYLGNLFSEKYHRYKSWDNCYLAFQTDKSTKMHALELAFYLASWGMYRGSSGLLQKSHEIHEGAIEILFNKESKELRCDIHREISREHIQGILDLKAKLSSYYQNITYTKDDNIERTITPTDTLITKIMLGTLGCTPAFDRYFLDGLEVLKLPFKTFKHDSLNGLFNFIDAIDIKAAQRHVDSKLQTYYPTMKILDIYFWQLGFMVEMSKKR